MNTSGPAEVIQGNPDGKALDGAQYATNITQRPDSITPEVYQTPQFNAAELRDGHVHTQQSALAAPTANSASATSGGGTDEAIGGVGAHEEQARQTLRTQTLSTSPGGYHRAEGGSASQQQPLLSGQPRQQPGQSQSQPERRQREQPHPQREPDKFKMHAQAQAQAQQSQAEHQQHQQQPEGPLSQANVGGQQQQQQQHQQQQRRQQTQQPQQPAGTLREIGLGSSRQQQQQQQQPQQHVQQPWQQPGQVQHDMSEQQQQQQQQQQHHDKQQSQTQVRPEGDHWRSSLLSGYAPPAAYTHVNVPVLMQQTAAAIVRWGEMQKTLDVTSDTATANLAAQAQARSSLRRDLTNLTQLADAQTKHSQRAKMRQMQAMQASKAPAQGGFQGATTTAPSPLMPAATSAGPEGGARGVVSGESYNFPQKKQDLIPPGAPPATAIRAAPMASTSHATGGPIGAALMQQGGGGPDHQEFVRTEVRPSEWPSVTALSPRPSVLSPSPSPPVPPQHALPLQQRLIEIKQRLDRTEPRNKWVVLVDAALRLLPHEGTTYKQFFMTIQGFLNNYNGTVGAEVAQALRSCLDPRLFDPTDIKRSQERMADVYSQWARRGQR